MKARVSLWYFVSYCGYKLWLTPSYSWLEFWRLDTSCSWLHPPTDFSSNGWIQRFSSSGWIQANADSRFVGWIRLKDDSVLQLTMNCAWLEVWRLNANYSWLHPLTHSSFGGWIQLKADSILRLLWVVVDSSSSSSGWIRVTADSILLLTSSCS